MMNLHEIVNQCPRYRMNTADLISAYKMTEVEKIKNKPQGA